MHLKHNVHTSCFILGHLSSCGLAIIITVMTVLFFSLMLLASTVKPIPFHPRCLRKSYDGFETNLYLVHDGKGWQQSELDILERIAIKYTQCDIELLILREDNCTNHKEHQLVKHKFIRPKRQTKEVGKHKHKLPHNKTNRILDLEINIGAKSLLKAFLERRRRLNSTISTTSTTPTSIPHLPNIHDVLNKFPTIIVKNTTKTNFFATTPLYNTWKNLNKETLNFAARILKLWENGGISFELPSSGNNTNITIYHKESLIPKNFTAVTIGTTITTKMLDKNATNEETKLIRSMIDIGYTSFRNLPEGLVTVDEEGIHMESKTICHAFFGEALVQLKHANNITTVPEIIKNTLKSFCVRGAVDSEYCNSINPK